MVEKRSEFRPETPCNMPHHITENNEPPNEEVFNHHDSAQVPLNIYMRFAVSEMMTTKSMYRMTMSMIMFALTSLQDNAVETILRTAAAHG